MGSLRYSLCPPHDNPWCKWEGRDHIQSTTKGVPSMSTAPPWDISKWSPQDTQVIVASPHMPQFTPYLGPSAYRQTWQPCQPANPKDRQGISPHPHPGYQSGPRMEPAMGNPGPLLPLLLTRAQQEVLRVLKGMSRETSVSCDPYHAHT